MHIKYAFLIFIGFLMGADLLATNHEDPESAARTGRRHTECDGKAFYETWIQELGNAVNSRLEFFVELRKFHGVLSQTEDYQPLVSYVCKALENERERCRLSSSPVHTAEIQKELKNLEASGQPLAIFEFIKTEWSRIRARSEHGDNAPQQ